MEVHNKQQLPKEAMNKKIFIPTDYEARPGIPKGAALLDAGNGQALCFYAKGFSFADLCRAANSGSGDLVDIDFDTFVIGEYKENTGFVNLNLRQGIGWLSAWLNKQRISSFELWVTETTNDALTLSI
jgi:hypothetical protein